MSLSDPEANTQLLNSTHLSSQGWASSKALFCEQNKINVDHKHAWHVDPWCAVFHARILVLKSNQDQGQVLNLIPAKLMFWCAFTHDTEKIPKKGCSRACAKGPAPTAVSTMQMVLHHSGLRKNIGQEPQSASLRLRQIEKLSNPEE